MIVKTMMTTVKVTRTKHQLGGRQWQSKNIHLNLFWKLVLINCMFRKRSQSSDSEESAEDSSPKKEKKKWVKKKPPKAKKPKSSTFDTGLDLALDEELALHILGSNK